MQYNHFLNCKSLTCYTCYDIYICGQGNVLNLCFCKVLLLIFSIKVVSVSKDAHRRQTKWIITQLRQYVVKFMFMSRWWSICMESFLNLWLGMVQHQKQVGCRESRQVSITFSLLRAKNMSCNFYSSHLNDSSDIVSNP